MRVTVLGSSCSIPRPQRACSSYLLETREGAIVADLGSGAFANLVRVRAPETIDAIVISHMHADHFLDLIPMRYALKYGTRTNDRRVAVYLPPGGEAALRSLVSAFAHETGKDFLGDVFDCRTYDPQAALAVADAAVRFAPTRHYIPTFACRFDSRGASVTYSGDTAPDDAVVALARETDAFICEATLTAAQEDEEPRGHSSAREAGALAKRARARRLVLSHYPASADRTLLAAAARSTFDGPIAVADDGYGFSV